MAELKATLVTARETIRMDKGGQLQRIAVYEYSLGDFGNFSVELPVGEDTPEKLQAAIDQKRQTLMKVFPS